MTDIQITSAYLSQNPDKQDRSYGYLKDRKEFPDSPIQVRWRDKSMGNKSVAKVIPESAGWDLVKKKKKIDEAADKVIAKYYKFNKPIKTESQIIQEKTLKEAIGEWLLFDPTLKQSTKDNHEYCLQRFFKNSGIELCQDITLDIYRKIAQDLRESLAQYISKSKSQNIKPISPRYYSMVRQSAKEFFNYLVVKKYLETNFIQIDDEYSKYESDKVVLKVLKKSATKAKKTDIWKDSEYRAIRDYLNIQDRTEFILLRYTGMDRADLGTLTREHILPNNPEYQVKKLREKRTISSQPWIKLKLFGPALDIVMEAYNRTENEDDLLFPWIQETMKHSHSYLYDRVQLAWKNVFPKKKFKNLKALRHTFATWALTKKEYNGLELPLETVQELLGHTEGSTILRETYLHREDGIGCFDPL